jgi:hypothetical protein
MKIELSPKEILEFIIVGIKNGNYEAAINIAQDAIDQILERENVEESKDESI